MREYRPNNEIRFTLHEIRFFRPFAYCFFSDRMVVAALHHAFIIFYSFFIYLSGLVSHERDLMDYSSEAGRALRMGGEESLVASFESLVPLPTRNSSRRALRG